MVEFERTDERELAPSMRMKICVAGVGGGGLNVLDRISLDRMMDATLVSMHSDVRVLGHAMTPVKIQLGAERMRGIGSGGDPENGYAAAQDSREQIRAALQGHDMVFVCCGLGGGTGSGAAPVVAEIAKEIGAMVFVFATMPFSFEGRRRIQQAEISLEHLGQVADALILFENNRMGELTLPKEGIQKAFSQADQLIGHSVRAIATMVMQPGIVRMSIADLLTALRGPNSRCLFGFGEARGTNRVADALKRALKSPLVNQGMLLQNARNLLVHVAGGESLTLAEVESLMKQLGKFVPEETQIMFGLAVEPKLGDMISVTLVSSLSVQEMSPDSVLGRTERVITAPAAMEALPVESFASVPALAPEPEPVPVEAYVPAPAPEPAPVQYQNGNAPAPVAVAPAPQVVVQQPVAPVVTPVAVAQPAAPAAAPVALATEPEPQLFQLEVSAPPVIDGPDLFSMDAAPAPVSSAQFSVSPSIFLAEEELVEETVDEQPVYAPEPEPAPAPVAEVAPVVQAEAQQEPIPAEENEDILRAEEELNRVAVEPPAPVIAKASIFSIIEDDEELEDEPVSYPDTPGMHWADKYLNGQGNGNGNAPAPTTQSGPGVAAEDGSRRPEARPAPVPAAQQPAAVAPTGPANQGQGPDFKQSTFDLSQEEVARFKGTDKTIVEGEDLDVPTWMRMRQKLKR